MSIDVADFVHPGDATNDQTAKVQAALDAAHEFASSLGIGVRVPVMFPPWAIRVNSPLVVRANIDLISRGVTTLLGNGENCFVYDGDNSIFRVRVHGLVFGTDDGENGFDTCIQFATSDNATARIEITQCTFNSGCTVGLDTVSFEGSRSTEVVIENCNGFSEWFFKVYADSLRVVSCWIGYNTGLDHEVMLINSRATIQDCIGGGIAGNPSNGACWIRFEAPDPGTDPTRSLFLINNRFGPEGGDFGGIPIVFNYAQGKIDFGLGDASQIGISIMGGDLHTLKAASGQQAVIVLFDQALPNFIRVQDVGGSSQDDGIVATDSGFSLPDQVAWWKLDGSGTITTAADSSGHGYGGTLTNNPSWTTGKIGGALSFIGASSQYVNFGHPSALNFGANDFSFSVWIFPTAVSTGQMILACDNSTGRQFALTIGENAAGTFRFAIFDSDSTYTILDSGNVLMAGFWNHVVITRSGNASGALKGYMNGVVTTMTLLPGAHDFPCTMQTTSTPVHMASRAWSGNENYYTGIIDDLRVYNRALMPNDVQNLFNLKPLPFPCTIRLDETARNLQRMIGSGILVSDALTGYLADL